MDLLKILMTTEEKSMKMEANIPEILLELSEKKYELPFFFFRSFISQKGEISSSNFWIEILRIRWKAQRSFRNFH
jgi:hypothetical protein